MSLSDYMENKLVDHVFRGRAYSAPSNIYVALFIAAPSDAGGGVEVSGGSYARVRIGPSDTAWLSTQGTNAAVPSSGTSHGTANGTLIVWPVATANWGTITHVALYDALTGGNLLIWNVMQLPKAVNSSDPAFSFRTGNLAVSFT